ncbi:MAG: DUF4832 domain-containing protein, partial [Clostridia bacterium]|nr:DUF4832 domain-containing protein [Clostridia bacterium]
MKRILAAVLTLAMLLSLCGVMTVAETAATSADELVLQDLSYDEVLYRVSQGDAGFTIGSTAIYAHHLSETSEPRNDKGFQFYYISLSAYSGSFDGRTDAPIDQWFLDYLDTSLANLQANGGGCMIRATYGLDGQEKCEPTDFNVLLGHVEQLSGIFAKYPDVITTVECGMIGAYGEMWGGLYSDLDHKLQVLDAWLTYLPDEISVNVRTVAEYYSYVNASEVFINNYKGQTVNGVTYPDKLDYNNFWMYTFLGEVFERIGIYNDAMLQDGNDGGTFPWHDTDNELALQLREGSFTFLGNQGDRSNYGGEFSGDTDETYRYKLPYWMPANAISRFYQANLSYYHGGNAAYQNIYKKAHTKTLYWLETHKAERERTLLENISAAGLGMTYSMVKDDNSVKVRYPDGTSSAVLAYDAAVALMDEYNAALSESDTQAVLTYKYTITTDGWDSATVDSTLFDAIAAKKTVTADLDDYIGQSAAKYFEDHVGYRIVLRESKISGEVVPGGTIRISGIVDNTGFANITKDKVTELVLSDGTNTYVVATDIDANSWKSAQRSTY